MLRTAALLTAALLAAPLASRARAQDPETQTPTDTGAGDATPAGGTTFSDPDWGFDFRLIDGFTELPREVVEPAEKQSLETYKSAATAKDNPADLRCRMHIFRDSVGTRLILLFFSPAAQVESTKAFRNTQHQDAKSRGLQFKDVGDAEVFKARGDLTGYLLGIDFGKTPGAAIDTRKYVAWTRAEDRSLQVILIGSPERCESLKPELRTSLASIGLKRAEHIELVSPAAAEKLAPAKDSSEASKSTVVFAAAGIAAMLVVLVLMMRKKPATA